MTEHSHLGSFTYETLVSLNNTGAILVQRNQFEEAYLTYLDALYVLEHGKSTEDEARGVEVNYESSLKAMVDCATVRLNERASQYYVDPRVFTANNYPPTGFSNTCQRVGGNDTGIGTPAVPSVGTTVVAGTGSDIGTEVTTIPYEYFCRILRQESMYLNPYSPVDTFHVDLITAVITYNFGLVHLKLSTVNKSETLYFRQTGELLMKHSYTAIPSLPPCSNYEDFKSIVTITVIVLSFMIDVCALSTAERNMFVEDLCLATEGLSFFGTSSNTAPAA
jgi:hypothetical protein